ncbi:MAG: HAD superfamily hydrolase (TIGR01549 family) [Verrucomicrobiales bacterium]|jgi:HAD superfamily hydrolase (TIGR01549 family)
MSIRGITFDLWDTLVHDDSDELKRKADGLPSKYQQRPLLVWESLKGQVSLEDVSLAYDAVDAAFNKVWKEHHITWPIAERLEVIFRGLKQDRPEEWDALVEATSRMEVDIPPNIIEGCAETLAALSQKYQLAIVSDAIVTPGSWLRELLANHGIRDRFSAFAFSDEVGHSKPHSDMFTTVLDAMKLAPEEVVHIGDRDHNDIKGAQSMGMKAILFTATRDVDKDHTTADAICDSYASLAQTIEKMNS